MPFPSDETRAALRSLRARIAEELRSHAYGYAVFAAFAIAGPIATPYLFPDAPAGLGLVGGLAFGVHAALCAVPHKFM